MCDKISLEKGKLIKEMVNLEKRKLFCEYGPLAYRISTVRCAAKRSISDAVSGRVFASKKLSHSLPNKVYSHSSLIRRTLGSVEPALQENKAVNLAIAAPKINGILIRPEETFSFWRLVGACSEKKGYKMGLAIKNGVPVQDIGGGMCQMTNLIHWLVLHSPLDIVEHHHHDGVDLFPDYGRQVPFGTGTSIFYNYIDYRFYNPTDQTFQLNLYTDDKYLHGELRCERTLLLGYHIEVRDEHFKEENGEIYRCGRVVRRVIDKRTGRTISEKIIKENHARVMYDRRFCNPIKQE